MKVFRLRIAATALGVVSAFAFPLSTVAQQYDDSRSDSQYGTEQRSDYSRMESNTPGQFDHRSEWSQQSRYGTSGSNEYGSRADGMPYDQLIVLGSNTQSVSVAHGETVKFVTPSGQEFRWRFDTARSLERFPLARIAPPDVSVSPQASVFVTGDSPTDRS